MDYNVVRIVLTACMEIVYLRAVMRVLDMRSNLAYCIVAAIDFVVETLLYIQQPNSQLRAALGILFYIGVPILMSVGRLGTRIVRTSVLFFVILLNELFGGIVYAALRNSAEVFDHIGPDNISTVVTVYLIMTLASAIVYEIIAVQCARIDEGGNDSLPLEMPVIVLLLVSLVSHNISYVRLFRSSPRAEAVPLAFAFSWISLIVIYLVYSSAKAEASARRETTEHALAARKAKHTQSEVTTMAQRAEGMRLLRHELANQMRAIHVLAESGEADEANRRLTNLCEQAQVLKGKERE